MSHAAKLEGGQNAHLAPTGNGPTAHRDDPAGKLHKLLLPCNPTNVRDAILCFCAFEQELLSHSRMPTSLLQLKLLVIATASHACQTLKHHPRHMLRPTASENSRDAVRAYLDAA